MDYWLSSDRLSYEQIEIIQLALEGFFQYSTMLFDSGGYRGRGFELYYQPIDPGLPPPSDLREPSHLFRLVTREVGEKDALLLLYEVLLGFGVEEEELQSFRNNCNTELADSMYVHERYPDFSILLALGNIVFSMSDKELYNGFNTKSPLDDVALMYYKCKTCHSKHFNEFMRPYIKQINDYFDRLKIKKYTW